MRSPAVGLPLGLALGMVAVATLTAAPPDLKTLFTNQAAVHVTTGRLSRLELPPEILTACRADLSDLRIFDPDGKEVAFPGGDGPGPERTRHARADLRA